MSKAEDLHPTVSTATESPAAPKRKAVRRKPVSQRIESMVHLCGYVFLFGFMLFFTFKDVLRIFGA